MAIIQAPHYKETEDKLYADPIIKTMAEELVAAGQDERSLVHDLCGDHPHPEWGFMTAALDVYKKRGGQIPTHIGGPSIAILRHLRRIREEAGDAHR